MAAAALTGAIVGLLPCVTHPVVVLAAFGLLPAGAQIALFWRAGIRLNGGLWLAASALGAYLAYGAGYVSFLLQAALLSLLAEAGGTYIWATRWPLSLTTAVLAICAAAAGLVLGGLQYFALPRALRVGRWIVSTMLGAIAVMPLAVSLLGVVPCDSTTFGVALVSVGVVGGLVYGTITAFAFSQMIIRSEGRRA